MIVAGPPRPRTPGDFLCGQKVTKKPLKKRSFLRIFLDYGGFWLRYDLVVSISSITSLGRCRSNRWNHSPALWSPSLGSPPRRTILWRYYRATGTVRAILPCYTAHRWISSAPPSGVTASPDRPETPRRTGIPFYPAPLSPARPHPQRTSATSSPSPSTDAARR